MFKKEYQGGSHIEVFSAQGRDPLSRWKLTGSVSRDYHKDVRGYVVTMEGGSSTTNTRMQLPKTDKTSLALVQPCLVFQLLVPSGARLAIDLSVVDKGGSRRRIQLSSSQREVAATPLNARVPMTSVLSGQWMNLCIDVGSFVSGLFKGQIFKSLEGISIGGSCMLRRVFTLRSPPPDTTGECAHSITDGPALEEIPRVCQMPTGVTAVETQVISYTTITSPSHDKQSSEPVTVATQGASSSENASTDERPTHIAFGKKVAIPDHILTSRQSSRSTLTSRQSTADSVRTEEISGQGLQPRPPSKPADPTVLRIQKKRVRIISGGKQKSRETTRSSSDRLTPHNSDSSSVDSGFKTGISSASSLTVRDNLTVDNQSLTSQDTGVQVANNTPANSKPNDEEMPSQDNRLEQDEHLALDVLQYKDSTERLSTNVSNHDESTDDAVGVEAVNGVMDTSGLSDDYLNSTGDSHLLDHSAASSVRHSDLDSSVDEMLYLYRSLPKSAERKLADIKDSHGVDTSGRSAGLDEDFVSPVRDVKQTSPNLIERFEPSEEQGTTNKETGDSDQLNETRLSDDYDWRQYASGDGTDLTQSEVSLRTRLANAVPSQETPKAVTIGPLRADSEMEGTLSGSVTLSGWTEKFKDAARNPMYDSLDTRAMGGMLSPLMGTLTDQPDFAAEPAQTSREGEELELMYDPQLNCFYDPVTGKYYELTQ